MPAINRLSENHIKYLTSRTRPYKEFDGNGLFLHVLPNGRKVFRVAYRSPITKKANTLTLGDYGPHEDQLTLKAAREKHREMRRRLLNGVDPSAERQERANAMALEDKSVIELVSKSFLELKKDEWVEGHYKRVVSRMEIHVYPALGDRPIAEITTPELHEFLTNLQSTHSAETAHRVRQTLSQVFRHAVNIGYIHADPTTTLAGTIKRASWKRMAAVTTPGEIGKLLNRIDEYEGYESVHALFKLMPFLMLRVGEIRRALWSCLDLEERILRIPPEYLKGSKERKKVMPAHLVPLSTQAVELFKAHADHRVYDSPWIFPSPKKPRVPVSDAAISVAIKSIGYRGKQTGHGFRATASTLLNESGLFHPDAIERQLAHVEQNKVRAAYDRSIHWEERVKMMQWLGDEYERLKAASAVRHRPNPPLPPMVKENMGVWLPNDVR